MKKKSFVAEIHQHGLLVFRVDTTNKEDVEKELRWYGFQYAKDGPIDIKRRYR